jgi:hypothetical protein
MITFEVEYWIEHKIYTIFKYTDSKCVLCNTAYLFLLDMSSMDSRGSVPSSGRIIIFFTTSTLALRPTYPGFFPRICSGRL